MTKEIRETEKETTIIIPTTINDKTEIPHDSNTTINTTNTTNNISTSIIISTVVETNNMTNDSKKIIPKFTIESINQEGCEKTGKLTFTGKISQEILRTIKFTLSLESPEGISLTCNLNGNKLDCETDRTINSLIKINETNITEYDEIILIIESFTSTVEVKCANAYIEKATSKLSVNIAFRQVSHFKKNDNDHSFSFYLIALISEKLAKGYSLNMIMDIKINGAKTEKNANCILQDDVSPNSGELFQGNFICSVQLSEDEYDNTDFDSISVSKDNAEINGVNDLDETLSNPKKTDELIEDIKRRKENGEEITDLANIVDYFEEKVEVTPLFSISSINIDSCSSTGKFIITGSFSDDIKESIKFDFVLTYPSSEINCQFDEANKNENINITCKSYDAFYKVEKILIEQRLIKKKNREIFII